jgi:hypothetical protein
VWIVPKYLFGRPSDTLNGALANVKYRLGEASLSGFVCRIVAEPARENFGLPGGQTRESLMLWRGSVS